MACPTGAVTMVEGRAVTDASVCEQSGECVATCPSGARSLLGRAMTVAELVREVEKDAPFYEESGGGVTFSGGEPLMQPRFLAEALDALKEREIHTAVDTCGHAPASIALDVLRRTDLVLYDVKSMDSARHEEWTGVPNSLILSNLRMLADAGMTLRIRVPLVPGFNDAADDIGALGRFVASLPGPPGVNVLPYHAIGTDKHARLGRVGPEFAVNGNAKERALAAVAALRECGLEARAGG